MKKTFLASAIASVLTVVSVMGAEIQSLEVDYKQKAKNIFQIIGTKIDNVKPFDSQTLEDFKQEVKSYIEGRYARWNLERTDASELENIFSSVELGSGMIPMVRHNKTLELINAALDGAVEKLAATLKEKEEAGNLGAIVHSNNNGNQNVDNYNENMQQAQENVVGAQNLDAEGKLSAPDESKSLYAVEVIADAKQAAEQPAEAVLAQLTTTEQLDAAIAFCNKKKGDLGQLAIGDYDDMLAENVLKLSRGGRLANLMDSVIDGTITITNFGNSPGAQLKGVCAAFGKYLEYKKERSKAKKKWSKVSVFEKSEGFEKKMKELIASVS